MQEDIKRAVMCLLINGLLVVPSRGGYHSGLEAYPEKLQGTNQVVIYNETKEPLYIVFVKTDRGSANRKLYVDALVGKTSSPEHKAIVKVLATAEKKFPAALAPHRYVTITNFDRDIVKYDRTLWVSFNEDDLKRALQDGSIEHSPKVYIAEIGSHKKVSLESKGTGIKFNFSPKVAQSAESFHKVARVWYSHTPSNR